MTTPEQIAIAALYRATQAERLRVLRAEVRLLRGMKPQR